jgi:hypothetical protein
MNTERFVAANVMALVTHTVVSIYYKPSLILDSTLGHCENQISDAPGG